MLARWGVPSAPWGVTVPGQQLADDRAEVIPDTVRVNGRQALEPFDERLCARLSPVSTEANVLGCARPPEQVAR